MGERRETREEKRTHILFLDIVIAALAVRSLMSE